MGVYHHLTAAERTHIARRMQAGVCLAQIALELGRHKSTVYRECQRNRSSNRPYQAAAAHAQAQCRARSCRTHLRIGAQRWHHARRLLTRMQFSPAMIAVRLGISIEWVYQWVYRQIAAGYAWAKHLRTRRSARQHRGRAAGAYTVHKRAAPIAQRCQAANARSQFGHWEADLLLGRQHNRSAVLVVKERTSRLTLLRKLPRRDSATVCRALARALKPYRGHLHSLTTDNGSEFAQHAPLAKATGLAMFVCDPHSPWQRGQVEGENKNIRQYLPKAFDADRLSLAKLAGIERKLNLRPKQVLNNHCPLVVANYLSGVALRG